MRKHVFFISLLVSLTAFSQGKSDFATTGKSVAGTDTLPEVIVLSKSDEIKIRSTAPSFRLNNENFILQGITDISDAVHRLPGTNLRDYGGAGGLKTVSIRGMGAGHTAVIYDGITLSDCQTGQIDLSRYSLDNINNVSLTIGDNEDIFIPARSAASAATLAISTFSNKTVEDSISHLTAKLRGGSFGLINPSIRYDLKTGKKFSMYALSDFLHTDNDYPFTLFNGEFKSKEKRSNSHMNSFHGELGAEFSYSPRASLSSVLYYYNNKRHLPGPVVLYNNENHEKLHDENFFAQIRYHNALTSKFSLLALAKFNWASSRYQDESGIYPGGILDRHYLQRETYSSVCVLYMPFTWLAADYSVDYIFNNFTGNRITDPKPYRHSLLQSLSAKVSLHKITFMARLLYSKFVNGSKIGESARNAQKFSPSVSLSFKPIDDKSLYLRFSYKNIFRMPTFNEAYFDHHGSLELKPEISKQFNIGATYSISSSTFISDVSFTADAYLNNVKDKIMAIPYNLFIWNMSNLGKVRSMGFDFTLETAFKLPSSNKIIVSGNYSYQRSQPRLNEDGTDWHKQLAYTPLNSGSFSVTWENKILNFVVHSNASGARFTTNKNLPYTRIAGYMETGITLFRKFKIKKNSLETRLDAINIFNKQYEIIANYPMPGRSFQITLKYEI